MQAHDNLNSTLASYHMDDVPHSFNELHCIAWIDHMDAPTGTNKHDLNDLMLLQLRREVCPGCTQ